MPWPCSCLLGRAALSRRERTVAAGRLRRCSQLFCRSRSRLPDGLLYIASSVRARAFGFPLTVPRWSPGCVVAAHTSRARGLGASSGPITSQPAVSVDGSDPGRQIAWPVPVPPLLLVVRSHADVMSWFKGPIIMGSEQIQSVLRPCARAGLHRTESCFSTANC